MKFLQYCWLMLALTGCALLPSTEAQVPVSTPVAVTTANHAAVPFPTLDLAYLQLPATPPLAAQTATRDEVSPPKVIVDLWHHMQRDMHLDLHLQQKRVQQELAWLQKHPRYLHRLQRRMQAYLPYLYEQVALRDMPVELALLPIVESALDVYAFSHGGAAGPWQFVRGTARQYGLQINPWYDGRRDIVASTEAALNYLTYLHGRFDDWYLALAGYNAGQGNVSKALARNPDADFFSLRLPRETRAYVPRLLALAALIKHPDHYGLTLPTVTNHPAFQTIEVGSQFQLTKLAETLGSDMETLRQWNPALARWATPPEGPHRIILPASVDIQQAQASVAAVPPAQRLDWQEITVRQGDTLSQIARRHNTDVASLKQANQLRGSQIRAGKTLLIPVAGVDATPPAVMTAATYKVAPGDSLWTIARQHKVNLRKLMIANRIGPKDPLPVGRVLQLPGAMAQPEVVRTVRYKVRKGDSLDRIANKFNVTVKQISQWNRLDVKRYLQPGQGLVLHVSVVGG